MLLYGIAGVAVLWWFLSNFAHANPAVLAEFRRKFAKTRPSLEGDPGSGQREAVIELEQAADSTKWAALVDQGASEQSKLAVVSAHDAICWFKATGSLLDREHVEPDPLAG